MYLRSIILSKLNTINILLRYITNIWMLWYNQTVKKQAKTGQNAVKHVKQSKSWHLYTGDFNNGKFIYLRQMVLLGRTATLLILEQYMSPYYGKSINWRHTRLCRYDCEVKEIEMCGNKYYFYIVPKLGQKRLSESQFLDRLSRKKKVFP